LKYRLIVNALVTLIKQFFLKILRQLRLILSSVSRQIVFHIVTSTFIFSTFVLFSWGYPTKHTADFIVSAIAPIQNTICGTVDKTLRIKIKVPRDVELYRLVKIYLTFRWPRIV